LVPEPWSNRQCNFASSWGRPSASSRLFGAIATRLVSIQDLLYLHLRVWCSLHNPSSPHALLLFTLASARSLEHITTAFWVRPKNRTGRQDISVAKPGNDAVSTPRCVNCVACRTPFASQPHIASSSIQYCRTAQVGSVRGVPQSPRFGPQSEGKDKQQAFGCGIASHVASCRSLR
jgi:hypothetical protein